MSTIANPRFTDLRGLNTESVVNKLVNKGYAVVPEVITKKGLDLLNTEVSTLRFVPDKEELGEHNVRQDKMSSVERFEPGSEVLSFRDEFQEWLFRKMNAYDPSRYSRPFFFNDVRVQKYAAGSTGIGTHRDNMCFVKFICAFTLSGGGSFVITSDREGNNPERLLCPPGTLVLLRGYNFRELSGRPYHRVDQIGEGRISLGLRIYEEPRK